MNLGASAGSSAGSPTGDVLLWGAILIVAIVLLGFVALHLRRRLMNEPASDAGEDHWSLQSLREMRKAGQISEEEFQTLRAGLISQFGAGSAGSDPDGPLDGEMTEDARRE